MYAHERSLVIEMQDKPFALVGVNSDRDLTKIREIIKEKNLNWRSFQNSPEGAAVKISTTWGVKGWPTIVILDQDMRIRYTGHNGSAAIDLAKRLVTELEQKGK